MTASPDPTVATDDNRVAQAAADQRPLLCGGCGYNLRGLPTDRCPECGRRFDPQRLLPPELAWEQRRHIGRFRAYWRTVWTVTFHPAKLAAVDCPMDWRVARRFRWITLLLACLSLAVAAMLVWDVYLTGLRWNAIAHERNVLRVLARVCLGSEQSFAITVAALLLALHAATGLVGFVCRTGRMTALAQQRAIALGQYSCGSLAWLPPAIAFTALTMGYADGRPLEAGSLFGFIDWVLTERLYLLGWAMLGAIPLAWWIACVQIMRRTSGCGPLAIILRAATLPLLWVLLAAGLVAGSHLVISFVVLVDDSLG